jgi:hypothetical protein
MFVAYFLLSKRTTWLFSHPTAYRYFPYQAALNERK